MEHMQAKWALTYHFSEGGMMRLETHKFLNSSFWSLSSYWSQTSSSLSSDSRRQYLSQQYPPIIIIIIMITIIISLL